MNINDYPAFVLQIWTEPDGHTQRGLAIAGLGLVGECGEVAEVLLGYRDRDAGPASYFEELDAKLVDECGDVLYYLTVLADWCGLTIHDLHAKIGWRTPSAMGLYEGGLELCSRGKEVSERVKKHIRDGREFTQDEMIDLGGELLRALRRVLLRAGYDLQNALDQNVAKLSKRYAHALDRTAEALL